MKRYTYFWPGSIFGPPHIGQTLLRLFCPSRCSRDLQHEEFRVYNPPMSNNNPLAGIVPRVVQPRIDGEAAITEYIEKIEGEVALDSYVKAQTSAPEVVKRINELENCLQRLANAALASGEIARRPELRAVAEEAKLLLKNRLEVDDTKHRFHSELQAPGGE